MKTITITKELYTAEELKDLDENAYYKAYNSWAEYHPGWCDEIIESLKAICKQAGVKIKNYEFSGGWGNRYTWRIEMPEPCMWDGDYYYADPDGVSNLTGARALTWIENNILLPNRIPWHGEKRWKLAKYGNYYRPGMVKPCPWTGYCADDDYINSLIKDVKKGYTLQEAFENLGRLTDKLIEQEFDEEVFIDSLHINEQMITIDGEIVLCH